MMVQILLIGPCVVNLIQLPKIGQDKRILPLDMLLTLHHEVLSLLQLDLALKLVHHLLVHARILAVG